MLQTGANVPALYLSSYGFQTSFKPNLLLNLEVCWVLSIDLRIAFNDRIRSAAKAEAAVLAIGPEAVPFLLVRLRRENAPLRVAWEKIWRVK